MIGETLAHFRVTDKLGEGGMGEVYRAEDTKLGREVALKVLPPAFAEDPERMARFAREAQVLASLNHPNIAAIFQVESKDDVHFLVMELVEGETLAERIRRGTIPLDEALNMSQQVIAALEEAHDHGIIHRDLKPANIKITPKGQVKVLDFGLAKALAGDSTTSGSKPSLMESPTLTAEMTGAGVLLGTAAYMSPEQARGESADRRADIWAFGVVLMEMLSGRTVYAGRTVSDTLASVLAREPEWDGLPATTPGSIRSLIERCLEKESKDRLQAIGEARILIERYLEDPSADTGDELKAPASEQSSLMRALPWAVAALLALGIAAVLWMNQSVGPENETPVHTSIELPESEFLHKGYGSPVEVSPDSNRLIVTVGTAGNEIRLNSRDLDDWATKVLAGGEGADRGYHPFFSPDGQWLGFTTPTELKKVPITGGTPMTLCSVNLSRGATWSANGSIIFAANPTTGLSQISDSGGEPSVLTTLDPEKKETTHRWPSLLPGDQAVLFVSNGSTSKFDKAVVEVLDLVTGERKELIRGGTYPRYAASGHLVYANGETLFAVPFDLEKLEITGSAAPVVEGVGTSTRGGAFYSFSREGRLAYAQSSVVQRERSSLVWIDREGNVEPLTEEQRPYFGLQLSPDRRTLAVEIDEGEGRDIWVLDLERDVPTRLTFTDGDDFQPVWSPDGQWIAYSSEHEVSGTNIYRKAADGSGQPEQLTDGERDQIPTSWSPDGRLLAFMETHPETNLDLWLLPLEGGEPEVFLASEFLEYGAVFSPDGKWLAYGSNESGTWDVYVRPVQGGGKWQISSGGGTYPIWSRDGRELLYSWDDGMYAVTVETVGDTFRAGRPTQLFTGSYAYLTEGDMLYDIDSGGDRFALVLREVSVSPTGHEHVRIVDNWFTELERTFSH